MAVVNTDNGHVITTQPIGDHVDATSFDPVTSFIFNSTGEGIVNIFHEDSPDQHSVVENVKTRPRAKTSALDLKTHQLFVPAMDSGNFTVLVFGK
ncbi:MAG: hypothetical protein WBC04_04730 [Candidatus Acidiferrales bacterium]|jgi:hypothetical protein